MATAMVWAAAMRSQESVTARQVQLVGDLKVETPDMRIAKKSALWPHTHIIKVPFRSLAGRVMVVMYEIRDLARTDIACEWVFFPCMPHTM